MTILFDGNVTKNSLTPFAGVTLKSYIHPEAIYNDGFTAEQHVIPDVSFSFGLFTIDPGHEWPATKFSMNNKKHFKHTFKIFVYCFSSMETRIRGSAIAQISKLKIN